MFFSFRTVYLRLGITKYRFTVWDLAINVSLIGNVLMTICFVLTYSSGFPYTWQDFGFGAICSILLTVGMMIMQYAFSEGPAGPVNSIVTSATIYTSLINRVAFG